MIPCQSQSSAMAKRLNETETDTTRSLVSPKVLAWQRDEMKQKLTQHDHLSIEDKARQHY